MADYFCVLLEDYARDPEHCTWYEIALAYDRKVAAKIFMEDHEDTDGYFGLNYAHEKEVHVLVWDGINNEGVVIIVEPMPSAGYYESVMDIDVVYEDFKVKTEEVKKPEYAQISQ